MSRRTSERYELALILPLELGEKETKDALKEIENDLKEHLLEVESQDLWGARNFAYPIKGKLQGNYVIYYLRSTDPSKIQALTKEFNINKSIVRFLIIQIPEYYKPVPAKDMYERTSAQMDKIIKEEAEKSSQLQSELEKITSQK